MADDRRETSALLRRHDQLKRWEDSETNKAATVVCDIKRRVKFQDGCVFLAACSSGDREEVLKLLERGADINTSNIDGLTALHQACIDDNLEMVEFLVDHGADVDVCDNEGWTPLHATASCGFTEIARFLLQVNANVAAVNNDGDLPVDICEDDEMEKLLQDIMDQQGVDADAARQEEENQMLADANKWLNNKSVREKPHHKTGATALHVACAKGYMKVIGVLMNAGVDINTKDHDGWTPLHAAAHWGQEEACKALAEHMCDMDIKNNAGQTAFDVADTEIVKLLDELKKKQASMKDKADLQNEVISTKGQHPKRRSSVTRMSVDQKQNVILKTVEQERVALEQAHIIHQNSHTEEEEVTAVSTSSGSEEESSESETEKQNEINKQTSNINQPRDPDKPPITATVEIQKPDEPKVEEKEETTQISIDKKDSQNEADRNENGMDEVPRIEKIGDSLDRLKEKEKDNNEEKEKEEKVDDNKKKEEEETTTEKDEEKPEKSGKTPLSRSLSAPEQTPSTEEVPNIPPSSNRPKKEETEIPSWRAGLRKTGSTSMVVTSIKKDSEADDLPRSASSPRLALDNNQVQNDRPSSRRPFSTSSTINEDSKITDRYLSTSGQSNRTYTPYRHLPSISTSSTSYQSAYIPYYRRQQEQNERREREKDERPESSVSSRITTGSTVSTTTSNAFSSSNTSVTAATTTTTTSTISSTSLPFSFRRSYEPPKRDEEAETQRKARAKRARETRRSTQGVTLEDIQKAEEVLSSMEDKNRLHDLSKSASDTVDSAQSRTSLTLDNTVNNARCSDITSIDDITTTVPRRRTWEDRRAERDDDTRSSFRRSRDSKDISETGYIPRRERNLGQTDSSLSSGSSALSRTSSLRATRLRNGDTDSRYDENREDVSLRKDKDNKDSQEKSHEERRESTALRARRARRERRSTGIVSYDAKNDDDDDKEEEKKETEEKNVGSRYSSRFGSSTDNLTDRYSRPSSYVEHSRSTPSLDLDYKKLYEDEKSHSEKLQKELENVKKELVDAKSELDRLVKRNEQSRISETNDKREKRALERRVSELEEEAKQLDKIKAENTKLKEENRALTRVISKLSK